MKLITCVICHKIVLEYLIYFNEFTTYCKTNLLIKCEKLTKQC